MNILSVRNLKKYYNTGENTVKALDGIDLDTKTSHTPNGLRTLKIQYFS